MTVQTTLQCGSSDPNDIVGPSGIGEENWVDSSSTLDYMIRFENDAKLASAPAAVVVVAQRLDDALDPNTFRLGAIGFGDVVIDGAVGKTSYEARLDLVDRFGLYLDISAGLRYDTEIAEAFGKLRSVDPETGQVPFSPFLGFLPPNKNGSEGQGATSYSVKPKSDAKSGTTIVPVATIIFDQNEPIPTDIENPAPSNKIDAGSPTSSVDPLPPEADDRTVSVTWQGQDDEGGSGVASYEYPFFG